MAGKLVSIEDAAKLLGVSVDEVNQFVDRKKLFPIRDGATLKFRVDEIERLRGSFGDDSSSSAASQSLELDLPTLGGDDFAIGDPIDVGDAAASAGSQTLVRGNTGGGASDLSGLALGGDEDDSATDSDDLALESIVGASSPSLARPAAGSGSLVGSAPGGDEPLTLDLSHVAADLGSGVGPGSQATGVGSLPGGSGFGAPLDSGLSLEDGGIAVSGIDLDVGAAPGSGVSEAGGSLAGDAFELGADTGDEDSASVVIATDESGDSSFFTNAVDDSASVQIGDSSVVDGSSSMIGEALIPEAAVEMRFSGWQIAGLTCCALVLLAGGFIMYDLAWSIRTPQGTPVSAPLLTALSDAFGWRR